MKERTFRNRVVESSLTLPFMAIITILLWTLGPVQEVVAWGTLALVSITTYTIVEWNNQCQLLRVRSRMNSVVFLALTAISPTLLDGGLALFPALCLLGCYFVLFKSSDTYQPQGHLFHGFLFLATGSIVYPPLLLLAPTLLISYNTQLRVLTFKPFLASLLGLALPYWFYAAVVVALNNIGNFSATAQQRLEALGIVAPTQPLWTEYISFALPDYTLLSSWQWSVLGLFLLLSIISTSHYLHNSYYDKIRTRQYFNTMLLQFVPILAVVFWYPQDARYTLPLFTINVTPFAAHYFAQSRSDSMRYRFVCWIVVMIAVAAMGYHQLWDQLLNLDILQYIPDDLNLLAIWKHYFN